MADARSLRLAVRATAPTLPKGRLLNTATPFALVVCVSPPQEALIPSGIVTFCPATGFPAGSKTVNCADPKPDSVMIAPFTGVVAEPTTTLACPERNPSCVRAKIICDCKGKIGTPVKENVPSGLVSTPF